MKNQTLPKIFETKPSPTNRELLNEFFKIDVCIRPGHNLAKWQNYKHPENPNFMQKVFWAAWETAGNLIVVFYLDPTLVNKNHTHAIVPMNGRSFEDAVFDYWSTN